ncbi:vexin [Varanus komodoensis]|uniref:vexin n=1 Tax=Varanus komodoensis TaxID=61221 RepID=UPI001CF7CEB0|nr:vexin [Varanus komodoensis]
MHQIYSCSDENLEVFTVISSKSCSPVRRKARSTQCIQAKKTVTMSDYHPQGSEKLLPHQVFCKDEDGKGFSPLQNKQQGFFSSPTKCPTTHTGMCKQQSFCYRNNPSDVKALQPQASHHNAKWTSATEPTIKNGVFADGHGKLSWKHTEDDISPTQGTEASLPLTGSTLYGTPSLLRKIWMKHKKKSEYLGAANSAFEAD